MLTFSCQVCRTELSAELTQAGQLVRCPACLTTLRVPANQHETVGAGAGTGSAAAGASRPPVSSRKPSPPPALGSFGTLRGAGKRYGFNCGYCSSRLEANEGMGGQEGQCPTCGNNIVIPILDRYGRLIDPMTGKIIKQDPHPVHAYAAAGDRAPKIIRQKDGTQTIQCPRCGTFSNINANNCRSCGMPFTMEGTTLEASGSDGFCVASLVLGIIGMFMFCVIVPSVLAVVFGVIGLSRISKSGGEGSGSGRGMAIAGIVTGAIGCFAALMYLLNA